jgi:hypothetical protein
MRKGYPLYSHWDGVCPHFRTGHSIYRLTFIPVSSDPIGRRRVCTLNRPLQLPLQIQPTVRLRMA